DVNTLSSRIATPEYEAAADRMAEASMTLLKNEGGILPIRADRFRRILAVVVSDDRSGTAGQTFARDLRAMHPNVNFQLYDPRTSEVELDRIITAADNADLVIAATYMSVRTGSGSISMSPAQNRFLNRL